MAYKYAAKTKTAKSLKQPKPSSPTDHSTVYVKKLKHDVKIKEEFIDMVDTRKGLAPIFGATSGKISDKKYGLGTAHRTSSRHEDNGFSNRRSSQRLRTRGYGRVTGRGMTKDKRDRVVWTSPTMKLRSICESENVDAALHKIMNDRVELKGNIYTESADAPNEERGSQRISLEDYDDSERSTTRYSRM